MPDEQDKWQNDNGYERLFERPDEHDEWQNELDEANQKVQAEPASAEWITYRDELLTMRDRVDYNEEEFSDSNPITNWPEKPE